MSDGEKRLVARFQERFDRGLTNVKFFVLTQHGTPTTKDLHDEVNRMLDTVTELGVTRVESVDSHLEQKRFDAAF